MSDSEREQEGKLPKAIRADEEQVEGLADEILGNLKGMLKREEKRVKDAATQGQKQIEEHRKRLEEEQRKLQPARRADAQRATKIGLIVAGLVALLCLFVWAIASVLSR